MQVKFSSKDIAEVLGKRHDNLLRAIRKYSDTLGDKATEYFIPEGEGRKATFTVTVKGCELIAGRMIGEAGDEFRLWLSGAISKAGVDPTPTPTGDPTEGRYTVAEVAKALGMSERAVYRNIQQGKLEAVECTVYVPVEKKFVTAEALESFKAQKEGK